MVGGTFQQANGDLIVLGHALALAVHQCQIGLRHRILRRRRSAVMGQGLLQIFGLVIGPGQKRLYRRGVRVEICRPFAGGDRRECVQFFPVHPRRLDALADQLRVARMPGGIGAGPQGCLLGRERRRRHSW